MKIFHSLRLRSRQISHGSNSLLSIAVFVGLIVIINLIADKESIRFDMTKNKAFTLSSQTVDVLRQLGSPIHVYGFFPNDSMEEKVFIDLIEQYEHESDKISVEIIDAERNPSRAKSFGITRYPTTIFQYNDRREEASITSEQEFTSSLLKLLSGTEYQVYFTVNHGEKNIDGGAKDSVSFLARQLAQENFHAENISLMTVSEIPKENSVVVIAGPKTPFRDEEIEILKKYLKNGGKLLLLADPIFETKNEDLLWNRLYDEYGITIHTDAVIIDPKSAIFSSPEMPIVSDWGGSKISEGLEAVIFPAVSEIEDVDEGNSEKYQKIVLGSTSEGAWGEKNPIAGTEVSKDEDEQSGRLAVGMTIEARSNANDSEAEEGEGAKKHSLDFRMVVFGDSDFLSDEYINRNFSSVDLFMNTMNWLVSNEDMISIRPKETDDPSLLLDTKTVQIVLFVLVSCPLLVAIIGSFVLVIRRRRG